MADRAGQDREGGEERFGTGVPGLDAILQGGFFRGSAFIISGVPGTGKTVLANQIAFNQTAQGGSVLYMTLLAESHGRLLQHMRRMSFFDPTAVPARLTYLGAFDVLEEEGLPGLARLLHGEIQKSHAGLVILDGLFVAEDRAESMQAFRRFVHDVQGLAEIKGCTVLLLTNKRKKGYAPEHTMVDGWIELHFERIGARGLRELEVHKYRGSGFIEGAHKFRITDRGIEVWPRLEAMLVRPSVPDRYSETRLSTGVARLDRMLGGGLRGGSTALVTGPSGSGKTTLGLHFLAQASEAEPGIFLGFYETPEKLLGKAGQLGLKLAAAGRGSPAEFLWWPATEQYLDEIGHRLIGKVRQRKAKRVVIDGLAALREFLFHKERLPAFLAALANELRALGATCLFTLETADSIVVPPPIADLAAVAENIVTLSMAVHEARLERLISVVKARDSGFDPAVYRFAIGERGISIGEAAPFVATVAGGTPPDRSPDRSKSKESRRPECQPE